MFNYNRYDRALGFDEKKLNTSDFIVSKTDKKGLITYANPSFIKITGYKTSELLNQNHNMVRHPDMPRTLFAFMWSELQKGRPFYGFIKNITKDGSFYWVFAYVVPDYGEKGDIVGYHSERRSPNLKAIPEIINLYRKVKQIEVKENLETALEYMNEAILKKAENYNNYVYKLQNQD